MPVVSVALLPEGRDGEFQAQRKGLLFELINRKYTLRYRVVTNNILDGPQQIQLQGPSYGLPALGQSYILGNDSDSIATCTDLKIKPTESPFMWHAEAMFDTDRLVEAAVTNPLNLPPEVAWESNDYEKPMYRDLLGVPCVNSAGDAFDPPLMYEDGRPVLVVTRNESVFNYNLVYAYKGVVNSDPFGPAPPYYAKVQSIVGNKQVDIGVSYYKVTYRIEFRSEGFFGFVLDRGCRDISRKLFLDPLTGIPFADPLLMNGRGLSWLAAVGTTGAAMTAGDNSLTWGAGFNSDLFPPLASLGFANTKPPHWYFNIRIDSEVLTVIDSDQELNWTVLRGQAGTAPAAHANGANITLEPYFLRFLPARLMPFAPLSLPLS